MKFKLENHIFVTSQQEIQNICKPLFEYTLFTYFDYEIYYKDLSFIALTSDQRMTEKFLGKQLYPTIGELDATNNEKKLILFSPEIDPVISDKRYFENVNLGKELNNSHRIYKINKGYDFYEVFGFGANINPTRLYDFYINNQVFLENFLIYFKQKAKKILDDAHKNRVSLIYDTDINSTVRKDIDLDSYSKEISLENYILKVDNQNVMLSRREFNCLRLINENYTSKEIARILSISHRTVETYVNNIKEKTNRKLKQELIFLAKSNFIFSQN